MLGQVIDWLLGRTESPGAPSPDVAAEDSKLPVEAGLEILRGSPERRDFLQGIRKFVYCEDPEVKDRLIDRVLARLALVVFDLPDPAAGVEARRYGLLDRVLKAASDAVQELSRPGFQFSSHPAIQHRERSSGWDYAGLVGAIALGLRKAFQVEVVLPGGAQRWEPGREALQLFCRRHGIEATGPDLWRIRQDEDPAILEPVPEELLRLVLSPEATSFLESRLPKLILALRFTQEPPDLEQPAVRVASLLRSLYLSSRSPEGKSPSPQVSGAPAGASEDAFVSWSGLPYGDFLDSPNPVAESSADEGASPEGQGDPDPAGPQGSSRGISRRVAHALQPERFLETLRRMILGNRFPKNERYGELFVRPDCVWLILPNALERLARIERLPGGAEILGPMERSLRGSPLVEPANPRQLCHIVRANPDWTPVTAVRIRTAGLLSDSELRRIGVFPSEIEVVPAAPDARWGRR